ncbi:MAG: beta-glucosidase [Ignavibacteriota bacterium]|nr:MAG: beta-glucosidase [Chlorobiota bacterium]MBE7476029.1 glycoside hydrolase family 3 C-terminal domain-containing protein [Ignavibacteriales bacterium]MBL1123166.1 beta-glucosidase [Ignavibacteriota bacterium]MCZ7614959.1 glycoside hydrolase family 3 C-terminal domain-containing protein [Ignavibacteriaceae bacterium]QKJ96059.1 MAG: beta-glucosidase [Ignavibacteriota bacterium]
MVLKCFMSSLLALVFINTSNVQTINKMGNNHLDSNAIHELVKAMTLEEKAHFVIGGGMETENTAPVVGLSYGEVKGAAGTIKGILRLKIPTMTVADGPAGVRIDAYRNDEKNKSYFATAWPVGTLLASSWDVDLVNKLGKAFGREVKEYGIDVILAPGMNLQRDPLNGRNFEYYSEDPLLTGKIAAAITKGLQSNGIAVSAKHFAANNQESNRNNVNAVVDVRTLREMYLRAFEIVVKEAKPFTIMSSYNKLNGTYTPESYDLLTTILRDEWGFGGYVMSDWYGGKDPVAQIRSGNDLVMPGTPKQAQQIVDAVKKGELDEKLLDLSVTRILTVMSQLPTMNGYAYSNKPDLKTNALIARQAAAEGMVLLKNEKKTLPLSVDKKILLLGTASYAPIIGGTGSGDVHEAYTISTFDGLKNAGYQLDNKLAQRYTKHAAEDLKKFPPPKIILGKPRMLPEITFSLSELTSMAQGMNAIVFTLGRNAGEAADRKIEDDFNLNDTELQLISSLSSISKQQNVPFIIILNVGGVVETASWRDKADAILLAWQGGQEIGNAIADIVSGKVNPSGKLPMTFPMKYEDVSSASSFPGFPLGVPSTSVYEEGIYVGYRDYNKENKKAAYEFGYGLSYTDFKFSDLKLSKQQFDTNITATVTVTNTGKIAGKSVVQLYLSAPATKLDKPSEELRAFAKTRLLKPGEQQTITFTLNARDLTSFDANQSAWVAEKGAYTVKVGSSSKNFQFQQQFSLTEDRVVEKVHNVLLPKDFENSVAESKLERSKQPESSEVYSSINDFYAGKWELTFVGTPNGDAVSHFALSRKDSKLTGEMTDPSGKTKPVPFTKIIESKDGVELFFSSQGYDVSVMLNKVDDDNLKGSLMNMFEAKAVRIKDGGTLQKKK